MQNKILFLTIILISFCVPNILSQDFQVSTGGTASFSVQVAADSAGNFVVVWVDGRNVKIPYGGTGSEGDIYGQRYNSKGFPIGSNFRISDDSSDTDISFASQIFPRIAMNKKGEFVVTWIDTRPKGKFNIYAQRFDSDSKSIGTNFLVNDSAMGGQLDPDVIIRDDGSFVITWINTLDYKGGINKVSRVYLQSFDTEGVRIGSNKKLNLYAVHPRIALIGNDNFVITADKLAQIYSFPSNKIMQPFTISKGYTRDIKVSQNDIIYITQVENSDIYIEAYDTLGNQVINNLKVNDDSTSSGQIYPSLTLDNKHVFVAWQDGRNGYCEGNDIYGQRFNLSLTRIGTNFKVSHETDESQQLAPVATLRNDTLYIVWLDGRGMRYFTNVYPPELKIDVWGTIQDFNNLVKGYPIHCEPPPPQIPSSFRLSRSFPNPTNGLCTFIYDLPEDANVKLVLYNILGKEVMILIDEFQKAGHYPRKFTFNNLSSGIYFARLSVRTISGSAFASTIKIALIK